MKLLLLLVLALAAQDRRYGSRDRTVRSPSFDEIGVKGWKDHNPNAYGGPRPSPRPLKPAELEELAPPAPPPALDAKGDPVPEDEGYVEVHSGPTLRDARGNFVTVIETFMARRGGLWRVPDKKNKALAQTLALQSIDEDSVVETGEAGRYRGVVVFKDQATKKPLRLEMTVDLGGPEWKVVSAAPSKR